MILAILLVRHSPQSEDGGYCIVTNSNKSTIKQNKNIKIQKTTPVVEGNRNKKRDRSSPLHPTPPNTNTHIKYEKLSSINVQWLKKTTRMCNTNPSTNITHDINVSYIYIYIFYDRYQHHAQGNSIQLSFISSAHIHPNTDLIQRQRNDRKPQRLSQ